MINTAIIINLNCFRHHFLVRDVGCKKYWDVSSKRPFFGGGDNPFLAFSIAFQLHYAQDFILDPPKKWTYQDDDQVVAILLRNQMIIITNQNQCSNIKTAKHLFSHFQVSSYHFIIILSSFYHDFTKFCWKPFYLRPWAQCSATDRWTPPWPAPPHHHGAVGPRQRAPRRQRDGPKVRPGVQRLFGGNKTRWKLI